MENIFTTSLYLPFAEAVTKVKEALASEKFGIITEIDVKKTLKEKTGIDFKNYQILGACNPALASRAIAADDEVGLLLPCNVIIYESGDHVVVSTIQPTLLLGLLENKEVCAVADEAEEHLKCVFDHLSQ